MSEQANLIKRRAESTDSLASMNRNVKRLHLSPEEPDTEMAIRPVIPPIMAANSVGSGCQYCRAGMSGHSYHPKPGQKAPESLESEF